MMKQTEIHALHEKICNAVVPLAVFKVGYGAKGTKITTELFRKAFEEKKDDFVGIYDERCLVEWLEADLA